VHAVRACGAGSRRPVRERFCALWRAADADAGEVNRVSPAVEAQLRASGTRAPVHPAHASSTHLATGAANALPRICLIADVRVRCTPPRLAEWSCPAECRIVPGPMIGAAQSSDLEIAACRAPGLLTGRRPCGSPPAGNTETHREARASPRHGPG